MIRTMPVVPWWKRLLFSLLSMVLAAALSLLGLVVVNLVQKHPVNIHSGELILTAGVLVGFCIIAWVVSAPVVLMIRDIGGWRFWLYWVLGTCVGPLLMLGLCVAVFFAMPHGPDSPWFNPAMRPLVFMAGAISSVTSLLYLSMLRWAQRKAGVDL
jgi:hypothetical protein